MGNSLYLRINELTSNVDNAFEPVPFRLGNIADKEKFESLLSSSECLTVHDEMQGQLRELIKCLNPSRLIKPQEYPELIEKHLNGIPIQEYGVWFYYPWSKKIVHLLDEEEFVEVRTNRNRYKITRKEQEILRTKKIGIVGLSVGQSIALTLAMERTCGELRLADFDVAELSNLNRLRTSLYNQGTLKTLIAAREIAEIDPYLKVRIFNDGLTNDNMDDFFTGNGKLDLFIEVCDGLDIKIQSRFKARQLRIPVVMDTNDRGMLDIERFDLEPERPVLHGLVGDLDPEKLTSLTNEEKIPIVLQIASAQHISVRGKASMVEVGQSISTWPQIASSVVLGGAVTTDVARRILLGQLQVSGRFYVDLDDIISDHKEDKSFSHSPNPYIPLSQAETIALFGKMHLNGGDHVAPVRLNHDKIKHIVGTAIAAPSTGNDQPWKWLYENGVLSLFHDQYRSYSFGDYKNIASYLTFGAVYEHVVLAAHSLGLEVKTKVFPLGDNQPLICSFSFYDSIVDGAEPHKYDELVNYISTRCTNRNLSPRRNIAPAVLNELKEVSESVAGAELKWLTEEQQILEAGRIIGAFDRMRILNKEGHNDFVNREMRWTTGDAEKTKDGIDILTLGLNTSQLSALSVIKDYQVIDFVNKIKGGKILEAATIRSVSCSSAIGLITMAEINNQAYIHGGRAYERMWLAAEKHGLALHPVISPLYFFPRLADGVASGLSAEEINEGMSLRERFLKLFQLKDNLAGVFLFKLAYAEKPAIKSLRIPVEDVLYLS